MLPSNNLLNDDEVISLPLQPKIKAVISAAQKCKSVPYVVPQLTSKEANKIIGIRADRGSKLEALQKVSQSEHSILVTWQ